MADKEDGGGSDDSDDGQDVYDVEVKAEDGEEPGVGAEEFEAEAHEGVPDQIYQEEVTGTQAFLEAARDPEYEGEADEVCQRLIEEQWLKAHAVRIEGRVVEGGMRWAASMRRPQGKVVGGP